MGRVLEFKIERDCKLKDWLKNNFSGRRIHFLREGGCILLNGREETVLAQVKQGDVLKLVFKETESFNYPPQDVGLIPVYADEDVTVVYKPQGVPSMPAAPHFDGNLYNGLKFLYPNGVFRVVTRLDKDTFGLVLVANNALAHSILHREMGQIEKTYVALVKGRGEFPSIISAPIATTDTAKRVVQNGGKPSKTRIIDQKPIAENTLLTLKPTTGRTHQLRVHLSHIGHPICGDALYGGGEGGQMLCCSKLEFIHPVLREKMQFLWDGEGEIRRANKFSQ